MACRGSAYRKFGHLVGRLVRRTLVPVVLVALAGGPAVARAEVDLDAAKTAVAEGRYADAATLLGETPVEPKARLLRVRLLLLTGGYTRARDLARTLVGRRRVRVPAHTLLGEAAWAMGDWDGAKSAFSAVSSSPMAHRARILLSRLLLEQGNRDDAAGHLAALIADYNNDIVGTQDAPGLAYVGMAARELHSYHDANDAFAMSVRRNPRRTETQLEWASMFLEKGDLTQAGECVQVALKYNPNHPWARTLYAHLLIEQGANFLAAGDALTEALATNPNFVPAHVARASMALRDMDTALADAHLDRALAVNPRHMEALSMRVAVRFLADDPGGQAAAEAVVLKLNPRFSRMYSIVARHAEWEHRYNELVRMARKALALDPEDPQAHATLALNLLRTGREREGRKALAAAWTRDRFNVRIYNMLNLFDNVIDADYARIEAEPFRVRLHRDERDVMEPYLIPLLRTAYAGMVERYGFTPSGPIDLELYAESEHFSVRTTGMPNVGVQGVCFGKLITAISPAAGSFNWGQILWHELSHVFHLQLSHNHVPRWFTEGLAEYETFVARPEWRREDDHNVWLARRRGELPKLSQLNVAFTRARSPDSLMAAYYTASLAVAYLIERFGFDRMTPMLSAWGKGQRTPAVFQGVLGVGREDVDAGFEAYLDRRLAKYDRDFYVDLSEYADLDSLSAAAKRAPTDADAQAALALAHLAARDVPQAEQAARAALGLSQHHPRAHFALALVYLAKNQLPRTYGCLRAILTHGYDGYELRMMLVRAATDLGRHAEAVTHALAAGERDPNRQEAWQALIELSERVTRHDLVERALRALVRIDQHSRIPHLALMVILMRDKAWGDLVTLGENTLFVHPASPELHRMLGDAYRHTGAPERALPKYDQALRLAHPKPGLIQLSRARTLFALKKPRRARMALVEAVRADPKLKSRADELRQSR